MRDIRTADEADRADRRMIEDRIDHFLVAVDDLKHALGRAGLDHQFGEAHRHARIAFGGLEEERSEEHTSELQSLMRISYAVFCLQKKNTRTYSSVLIYTHQDTKHTT